MLEHARDARADVWPDLFPDSVRARADDPVALDADGRQIGVVAEEGEIGTPEHPHRVARVEQHAHDRFQRLRPGLRRAERRRRPIDRAYPLAGFAAPGEEGRRPGRRGGRDVGKVRLRFDFGPLLVRARGRARTRARLERVEGADYKRSRVRKESAGWTWREGRPWRRTGASAC